MRDGGRPTITHEGPGALSKAIYSGSQDSLFKRAQKFKLHLWQTTLDM